MSMPMNGNNDSSKRFKDHDCGHNLHLPHDIIIYNILTRVSAKDLNRFRCVCKLWSNLFNDPLCMSLYSQYTTKTSITRGFISVEDILNHGNNKKETTFVFFDCDKQEETRIPVRLPGGLGYVSIWIEHSFDGMLLISFNQTDSHKYFVYDLVTGSWSFMVDTGDKYLVHKVFLAFDPVVSKYKMVVYSDEKFDILTGKGWSYVSIPDHLKDFEIETRYKPVSVNYCLHWITIRKMAHPNSNELKEDNGELLRLDASKEKVSTITLPVKAISQYSFLYHGLLEMKGLLWFFQSPSLYKDSVQLWYLKKKTAGDCGFEEDKWVVMWNVKLTTEISLQQLINSGTNISAKSQASPLLLKNGYWSSPVMFVMDPKCKIVFTYMAYKEGDVYLCSYDTELNQGSLIYTRKMPYPFVHYWQGSNVALSSQ